MTLDVKILVHPIGTFQPEDQEDSCDPNDLIGTIEGIPGFAEVLVFASGGFRAIVDSRQVHVAFGTTREVAHGSTVPEESRDELVRALEDCVGNLKSLAARKAPLIV